MKKGLEIQVKDFRYVMEETWKIWAKEWLGKNNNNKKKTVAMWDVLKVKETEIRHGLVRLLLYSPSMWEVRSAYTVEWKKIPTHFGGNKIYSFYRF